MNAYEKLGRQILGDLEVAPWNEYWALQNKVINLQEILWDILVTHHNKDDVSAWIDKNLERYKEAAGWEDE